MEWGGEDDINDNEIPWALQTLELRYYNVERIRYGFSGNIEYRPNEKNRYFLGGMFNQRDDSETRDVLEYKVDDGDYQSSTEVLGAGIERQLRDRLEVQNIMAGSAGGQNQFGDWLMDYTLAYSYAEEDRPDGLYTNWELDEDADLQLDLSDNDSPQITVTNLGNGNYEKIADNFVLDGYEFANDITTNSELNASLNFKVPLSLAGNPSYIKFGGRYRNREKDRDDQVWDYGWEGDDDILMSRLEGEFVDKYLNDEYTFGPRTDADKSKSFFDSNRDQAGRLEAELNHEESIGADYTASENIMAGYALLNSTIGSWMLMAGLRYEGTQYDTKGYEVIFDDEGDYDSNREIKKKTDDSQILPGLHVRYALSKNSNLRAAYSKTLARAPYYALAPYTIVLAEDEELLLGNPDLKTTESQNLDLFAEYYLPGLGVLAGGVFYKSLSNIIYEQTYDQAGGPYDGFEVTQPVNGDDATLLGFEINYQQQLTSLPGFWNGFGVYANFTWTDSKATLATGRETALPGQAQTVGNFAISYEKFGFTGRFGVNYHGKYIDEIGDTEAEDIYYDEHWQWDFAASQRIVDNVRFYLEWVNITDAPLRYYIGETDRPIQREFYKWWIHTGFKFEF
jgi:TonB-dependent receptor